MRTGGLILAVFILLAGTVVRAQHAFMGVEPTYVPQRVYSSGGKAFSDFEVMAADLATADVAIVGEQHDDPATHRLERAILEAVSRRGRRIAVSLEMFERDVQKTIDEYLAGRLAEFAFLRLGRPWPRYDSDYRPLVELAKLQGWPVIASNVPRRLAAHVAKEGLAGMDRLPPDDRRLAAREVSCPEDAYFHAFVKEMQAHPSGQTNGEEELLARRYYDSQCVKDETMAEAIAEAYRVAAEPRPVIVHFTGAFHSDHRQGTVSRVERRLPGARVRVVSIVPVSNLDTLTPDADRARGDFIVYSLKRSG